MSRAQTTKIGVRRIAERAVEEAEIRDGVRRLVRAFGWASNRLQVSGSRLRGT
jgi:hypothetical protein